MKYSKTKDGEYITGVRKSPMDIVSGEEIKEEEYLSILKIISTRKKDQRLMEKDGKIFYVDVPGWDDRDTVDEDDPSKGSLTPDQAWKIISSSNISKEDKEKLYKYIYAKEELK